MDRGGNERVRTHSTGSNENAISEYEERRRTQNRLAQQRYRERHRMQKSAAHTRANEQPDPRVMTEPTMAFRPELWLPAGDLNESWAKEMDPLTEPLLFGGGQHIPPQQQQMDAAGSARLGFSMNSRQREPSFDNILEAQFPPTPISDPTDNIWSQHSRFPTPALTPPSTRSSGRSSVHGSDCAKNSGEFSHGSAYAMLQKQQEQMMNHAEQYLRHVVSLHQVGVSLGIYHADHSFEQLLQTVTVRLRSLLRSHEDP